MHLWLLLAVPVRGYPITVLLGQDVLDELDLGVHVLGVDAGVNDVD